MRTLSTLLLLLIVFTGCDQLTSTSEDLPRLMAIDKRLANGDYDYALTAAKKYVDEYPDSFNGWSVLGWAHLKSDELEHAKSCFEKSIAINPDWDNAYVGKGVMYRKMGQHDLARESYLAAIQILPENPEAYSSLLVIELLEGNNDKAIEYGEKAWGFRKNLASIPANLAIAYHYAGNQAQRDRYFKHAKDLKYHALDKLQAIFDSEVELE